MFVSYRSILIFVLRLLSFLICFLRTSSCLYLGGKKVPKRIHPTASCHCLDLMSDGFPVYGHGPFSRFVALHMYLSPRNSASRGPSIGKSARGFLLGIIWLFSFLIHDETILLHTHLLSLGRREAHNGRRQDWTQLGKFNLTAGWLCFLTFRLGR